MRWDDLNVASDYVTRIMPDGSVTIQKAEGNTAPKNIVFPKPVISATRVKNRLLLTQSADGVFFYYDMAKGGKIYDFGSTSEALGGGSSADDSKTLQFWGKENKGRFVDFEKNIDRMIEVPTPLIPTHPMMGYFQVKFIERDTQVIFHRMGEPHYLATIAQLGKRNAPLKILPVDKKYLNGDIQSLGSFLYVGSQSLDFPPKYFSALLDPKTYKPILEIEASTYVRVTSDLKNPSITWLDHKEKKWKHWAPDTGTRTLEYSTKTHSGVRASYYNGIQVEMESSPDGRYVLIKGEGNFTDKHPDYPEVLDLRTGKVIAPPPHSDGPPKEVTFNRINGTTQLLYGRTNAGTGRKRAYLLDLESGKESGGFPMPPKAETPYSTPEGVVYTSTNANPGTIKYSMESVCVSEDSIRVQIGPVRDLRSQRPKWSSGAKGGP